LGPQGLNSIDIHLESLMLEKVFWNQLQTHLLVAAGPIKNVKYKNKYFFLTNFIIENDTSRYFSLEY
jgi:hypothetical protein